MTQSPSRIHVVCYHEETRKLVMFRLTNDACVGPDPLPDHFPVEFQNYVTDPAHPHRVVWLHRFKQGTLFHYSQFEDPNDETVMPFDLMQALKTNIILRHRFLALLPDDTARGALETPVTTIVDDKLDA